MGNYTGTYAYELFGRYILHILARIIEENFIDLYRNESRIILRNCNRQKPDEITKENEEIFKEICIVTWDFGVKMNGWFIYVNKIKEGG